MTFPLTLLTITAKAIIQNPVFKREGFVLKENEILTVFHYIPLHSAPAGHKFGRFDGVDEFTTQESERLVRLPMYYHLGRENRDRVIEKVKSFFGD